MGARNRVLDIAKGIGIILVVIGHCYSRENIVLQLIYGFHMPFFFIASGILYAEKLINSGRFRICKSAKKLLIPYFVFETVFVIMLSILNRSESTLRLMCNYVQRVLTGLGITVTWYLPCCLIVYMVFALIKNNINNTMLQKMIIAFIFIVGVSVPVSGYWIVPLRAFVGLGFFAIGFYFKDAFCINQVHTCIYIINLILYILLVYENGMVSLVSLDIKNPVLYTINGILGSFLLIQLSGILAKFCIYDIIRFIGQNSLIILCTHMIIIEVLRLLDYKLFNNLLPKFGIFEGVVFGAIVLSISLMAIPVCKHYLKPIFEA